MEGSSRAVKLRPKLAPMAKKVMVLEDQADLSELIQELLSFEGYEVLRPKTFENLIEDLRTSRPDAVLMDVNLNGVNGLDLLSKLRTDEKLKDTYVVLSSGSDLRRESLQRGANDFLMKPYMPDELVKLLNQKIRE